MQFFMTRMPAARAGAIFSRLCSPVICAPGRIIGAAISPILCNRHKDENGAIFLLTLRVLCCILIAVESY